jgi:hypothetical protein
MLIEMVLLNEHMNFQLHLKVNEILMQEQKIQMIVEVMIVD